MSEADRTARIRALTPREREVLRLICNGLDYSEIADELGIVVQTVRSHGRSLFKSFGVTHRGGLIALALGRTKRSPLP